LQKGRGRQGGKEEGGKVERDAKREKEKKERGGEVLRGFACAN